MTTNNTLKNQLITSCIITLIVLILGSAYLFYSITKFNAQNERILENTQQQIAISTTIDSNLKELFRYHMEKSTHNDQLNPKINSTLEKLDSEAANLQVYAPVNPSVQNLVKHVESIVKNNNSINFDNSSQAGDFWLNQDQITTQVINNFINSVITKRTELIANNKSDFNIAIFIIGSLIFCIFLLIVFTFNRVIKAINNLKETTDNLTAVNNNFLQAQNDIQKSNWVLEKSALISEGISGLDDENEICNVVSSILNDHIQTPAIAIYIKKPETKILQLCKTHGINNQYAVERFHLGDGFLGKIADDKNTIILANQNKEHLNIVSSLVQQTNYAILYCPLVHDDETLGLIEIALWDLDEQNKDRYLQFFNRISRVIATRILFGQSHLLVQELLEETKRQTEELEAQQEELRITNEELVHKTHLLESSEEELRVQQEELTQTNQELNKKAEELELRNTDLNRTQTLVEQKILEVEQASKYKSEFMANMSHELRTPLNSILILAKLLQDNKLKNLNPEQIKYAKVIHDAGADLLELINAILDLSKIEAGQVELNIDKIKPTILINNIEEMFKAVAKDKGINFITSLSEDFPQEIISDEYRIQQVLKNFLSNAFKFTEAGGQVELNTFIKSNNIHFQVLDTGKGISKEKQEIIFEAFKQEDGSTSRKYGGTGLGLSISKEIASLLAGRITLESELGVGSIFSLIIPLQNIQEEALSTQPQTPKDQKKADLHTINVTKAPEKQAPIQQEQTYQKRTILIVEDDINFADILKGFAEDYGFDVILAHDGAKGIEIAKSQIPNAIILDVMLPIADGWEVLRTLKNDEQTKHIPIHMMSAASFSKKEFIERGAIGFMRKPVNEQTIQQTLENININLSTSVKTILLVEDQELQSDFIKNSFTEQNINVIQTFSLTTAWAKLNEEKNIDCIILDLSLPDGNGLELIEKIKENKKLSEIPIIINTAYELPKEQYDKILSDARATILKSDKSSDRLIDEVNLFLNKLNTESPRSATTIPTITHANNLKGKRVLIADDDMRNVFALSTSLQNYDMVIEIANNGKEAVDILANPENQIDIVLMDIMMPEMDGYQAIGIIREDLKLKNLPILAVTAKAMKGDREKSIQLGANDYVSKPIDIDKLTSLMQVWLG